VSRHLKVVLKHGDNEYRYDDPFPFSDPDDDEAYDAARFMYLEGNYACDCNRSLFIDRYCDNAPDEWPGETDEDGTMPCGDEITLTSLIFVDSTGNEHIIWPNESSFAPRGPWRKTESGLWIQ
jgi:hypothetical protein